MRCKKCEHLLKSEVLECPNCFEPISDGDRQVITLVNTYANSGEFGRAGLAKKYPYIDFKKLMADVEVITRQKEDNLLKSTGILASGNGSAYSTAMALEIGLTVVIFIGILIWMSATVDNFNFGMLFQLQHNGIIFMWLIWGGCIAYTVYAAMKYKGKAATKISVFETVVSGSGLTDNPYTPKDFELAYDKITNVDKQGKDAVIVYTQHAKYTCYCTNPDEISTAINDRLHQAKSTIATSPH